MFHVEHSRASAKDHPSRLMALAQLGSDLGSNIDTRRHHAMFHVEHSLNLEVPKQGSNAETLHARQ